MKSLLLILASVSYMFWGSSALALPDVTYVSLKFNVDGAAGSNAGRQFDSSRTDTSLGCSLMPYNYCPNQPGYAKLLYGWNAYDNACCRYTPRENAAELIEELQQSEALALREAMNPSANNSFWGYINTANRSPNAGRGNSVYAKLDACLGHANVDADTDVRTCETACQNSLKNQYCQDNSAAVCIDRCECRWGEPGCEGL